MKFKKFSFISLFYEEISSFSNFSYFSKVFIFISKPLSEILGFIFKVDNFEANFDYINVPIILKLYLAAGLNLQVGPQFGFLSTSELINTTTNVKDPQSAKSLFDKKSDLSVAIGAGWDLPFGLTLDARYNLGLADVQLKPSTTAPLDFKNKVIQISLGYKFIKKGK